MDMSVVGLFGSVPQSLPRRRRRRRRRSAGLFADGRLRPCRWRRLRLLRVVAQGAATVVVSCNHRKPTNKVILLKKTGAEGQCKHSAHGCSSASSMFFFFVFRSGELDLEAG